MSNGEPATKADLAELETRLTARITALDERVTTMDSRIASMDSRISSMDSRISSMDERISSMDSRISSMDSRISSMDERITALDERMGAMKDEIIETMRDIQTEMLKAFYAYAKSADAKFKESEIADMMLRERLTALESRMTDVERRLNLPPQ